MSRLLAAFYGDDFTGSVDAMLQFAREGLRVRLFVGLPEQHELEQAAGRADAVGVAGIARSLPTDEIAAELVPVLESFAALDPRVVQYKVCSTADSSPDVGSIGRVIELGREVISAHPVPVLIAQPDFGRYTVFGHHFAAEGDTVYRLDRQPTMSSHPSTPMHESDLAVHVGRQTELPIGRLFCTDYGSAAQVASALSGSRDAAIVLDALSDEQLRLIGTALLRLDPPVFAVGSGGLSRAIALGVGEGSERTWGADQGGRRPQGPTLAVSGSRSATTRRQLETARDAGWAVLPLRTGSRSATRELSEEVVALLAEGRNVALSSHDMELDGVDPGAVLPTIAATAADVIRAAVSVGVTARVIVSGGDTSSRVVGDLGVRSLSIAANPWGNIVILTAHAEGGAVDGVELLLKGGQVGEDDLLVRVHALGDQAGTHGDDRRGTNRPGTNHSDGRRGHRQKE